jgi:HK97 family phage prohead protease
VKKEIRFFRVVPEVRAAGDGEAPMISGYAAVFNQPTDIGGMFEEVIMPGAFSRAIKEKQDVRGLVDHNPERIIGRTKSGTLRLKEDKTGLSYEIDPPNTTVANDLVESLRRGDIDQSSFSFIAVEQMWREEKTDAGTKLIREIHDCDIFDVSPVTFPAYEGTSAGVRSSAAEMVPTEYRSKYVLKEETRNEDPAAAVAAAKNEQYLERMNLKLRLAERV